MAKTIVSTRITGTNTIDVLFREVAFLGTKKGLDPEKIQREIMDCESFDKVNKILKDNFDGEIKIIE